MRQTSTPWRRPSGSRRRTAARWSSSRSVRRRSSSRCARPLPWGPTAQSWCRMRRPPDPISRDELRARKGARAGGADLVLFGQQASDSDGAVMWAAVADRLRGRSCRRWPTSRWRATGDGQASDGVRLRRHLRPAAGGGRGLGCDQRAALPVLKGIMGAKSKPTETLSLADIGVEPERVGTSGSRTTRHRRWRHRRRKVAR